jgi:hypothetical protein
MATMRSFGVVLELTYRKCLHLINGFKIEVLLGCYDMETGKQLPMFCRSLFHLE